MEGPNFLTCYFKLCEYLGVETWKKYSLFGGYYFNTSHMDKTNKTHLHELITESEQRQVDVFKILAGTVISSYVANKVFQYIPGIPSFFKSCVYYSPLRVYNLSPKWDTVLILAYASLQVLFLQYNIWKARLQMNSRLDSHENEQKSSNRYPTEWERAAFQLRLSVFAVCWIVFHQTCYWRNITMCDILKSRPMKKLGRYLLTFITLCFVGDRGRYPE
jgi:hypothetical protein